MSHTASVVGGILVGGGALRMGGYPKGKITIGGQTIIERTLAALTPVCDEVYLLGEVSAYQYLGRPMLADFICNAGPLGGMATLMRHAQTDVLIAACDMPNLTREVFETLLCDSPQTPRACRTSTFRQPLVSYWQLAHLEVIEQNARNQASVMSVFEHLDGHWVLFDDPTLFLNLNTPEDLRNLDFELTSLT